MNYKLEFKSHNANLLSIKDQEGEIDFSSNKFDLLFEKCIGHAESVFFKGERAFYESEEINLLLNKYSTYIIQPENRNTTSLCSITPGCLTISRNGFKIIWEHFEYPFLFFVGKGMLESTIIECLSKDLFLEDILKVLTNTLVVYRSFEQDVFWVQKSTDIAFPDFNSFVAE